MEAAEKKRGRPFAPLTIQSVTDPFKRWPLDQVKTWSLQTVKAILASLPDVSKTAKIRWLILAGLDNNQIFQLTGQRLAKIADTRRLMAKLSLIS